MSTHWDIRCDDCGVEAGMSLNHGDQEMRDLISHADAIAALSDCHAIDELSVYGAGCLDRSWFSAHRGHKLRPFNEYGEYDTPCSGRGRCPQCGTEHACCRREHGLSYSKAHAHVHETTWPSGAPLSVQHDLEEA